jgi:hypothetical protein
MNTEKLLNTQWHHVAISVRDMDRYMKDPEGVVIELLNSGDASTQ